MSSVLRDCCATPVSTAPGDAAASAPAVVDSLPRDPPLVACARHKSMSVSHELSKLEGRCRLALEQAAANRDAAIAAAIEHFHATSANVLSVTESTREALTAELIAANIALRAAIDATSSLAEVSSVSKEGRFVALPSTALRRLPLTSMNPT